MKGADRRRHAARVSACLLIALLALGAAPRAAAGQNVAAEEGWLHLVWDDESGPITEEPVRAYLVRVDGSSRELSPAGGSALLRQILALDRQYVRVETGGGAVDDVLEVQRVRAEVAPHLTMATVPDGRTPFATLLCRFPEDVPTLTRAQVELMMGGGHPGMSHFYDEISGISGVLGGSVVTSWLTLPQPRSAYIGSSTDHGGLARDCTAAAAKTMDLRSYFGINLQFSGPLSTRPTSPFDPLSFGGSWTLILDGEPHRFGMTWISSAHASNHVVYAHEMGHALGWPHSSGRYGNEYDSDWDLMSRGYLHYNPDIGWLPIHTISSHKDHRGWIPAARRWLPELGTETEITLLRSALPPDGEGFLMARLQRITGSFYTLEARQLAGYDATLPGEAVLMHEVFGVRSYVVDGNTGSPNGADAMWTPGRTFSDPASGIEVEVLSRTEAGYSVRIRYGYLLEVEVEGDGRVTGLPSGECTDSCRFLSARLGEELRLQAHPGEGHTFAGWEGTCSGTEGCFVSMNYDRTLRARFLAGLEIVTETLRAPVMGAAFADTLRATHGAGARWEVSSGELPAGLTLDTLGVLSGIPEEAGTFSFTARAETVGLEASRTFVLTVTQPALGVAQVVAHLLGGVPLSLDHQRFLDLLGNRNGRVDVGDVRAWLAVAGQLSAAEARELEAVVGPRRATD